MAMKIIGAGTQTSSADANEYFVNTKYAVKPGPEQKTSAPNLSDDADLQLHVDASKIYEVVVKIQLGSPSAAGFGWAFSAPAGSVLYGTALSSGLTLANSVIYDGVNTFFNTRTNMPTFGGGVSDFVLVTADLVTAGTAGNFTFRWAQQNSNASATTVRGGSSMRMHRLS